MTKAAQHFGKRLDKFFSTEETRLFVEELDRLNPTLKGEFVDAQRGRNGGTWAHPKLAVFFARWLDVKFAVWCDAVIEDILKGNAGVATVKPEQSAILALPQDYASVLPVLAATLCSAPAAKTRHGAYEPNIHQWRGPYSQGE